MMAEQTVDDDVNAHIQDPLLINRNNEDGRSANILNLDIEEEEEIFLSGLPAYKTYAKFFLNFFGWPLAVYIFDIVLFSIVNEEEWREYKNYYGSEDVAYLNVKIIVIARLIINTVFLFLAAKAIDKDVAKLENEQVVMDQGDVENFRVDNTMDWNDYRHIYGRVARKIDVWLLSACKTHETDTETVPIGTSFLSHLCWITWAFCFANSYSRTMDLFFPGVTYQLPSAKIIKHENITGLPEDLLQWIHSDRENFYHSGPYLDLSIMNDRLIFLGAPLMGDNRSGLHEIVAINNTLITRYLNVTTSRFGLLIPIENSIDKDDPSRASEYCFLSGFDRDIVNCMSTIGNEIKLKNATFNWEYEYITRSYPYYDLSTASYQNLVFIKRRVMDGDYRHKEVIKVDPATMEISNIFATEIVRSEFNKNFEEQGSTFNFFNEICGLGLTSYYLISKQGMISGVFPFTSALAFIVNFVLYSGKLYPLLIITGMVFFHYMIHSGNRWRNAPPLVWVDKNVCIWALYGWNFSFAFGTLVLPFEFDAFNYDLVKLLGIISLILTSLILGHPGLHVIGYISLVFAFIFVADGFLYLLLVGFVCIILGNWFSKYKLVVYTRSRYILRYFLRCCMNRFSGSCSRYNANPRYE